jgi:hypothetical protein
LSDSEEEESPKDSYDMMTRHLWSVGERSGWFRDADFDGLVSIRWVSISRTKLICRIKKRVLRTYPQAKPGRRNKEMAKRIKEWDSAVATLNPEVAMKITSKVVQAIMARW